ncbi:MAG: glutamate 5-kinase, partial [Micrococcales bacterium]
VSAKLIVVKVGSSSITGTNEANIDVLVEALAKTHQRGTQVILVTSGAIATGMPLLGLEQKPEDLPTSQALAAIGQSRLIAKYQQSLERFDWIAGQVLLTSEDLEGDQTRANAKAAIDRIVSLGVLPIVNENDTVATAEIRFGDNDRLAALVAELVGADALILLSDVDALYTMPPANPGAKRIIDVDFGDDLAGIQVGGTSSGVGTGGAVTKVAAAKLATNAGSAVLLTSFANIDLALSGESVGTWFSPRRQD